MFWTEVNGERGRELLCLETGTRVVDIPTEAALWKIGGTEQRLNVDYQTMWSHLDGKQQLIKRFN